MKPSEIFDTPEATGFARVTPKDEFITYALDCGFTEKQAELLWQLAVNIIPRYEHTR